MWTIKPGPMPVQFFSGRTGAISAEQSQPPPRNFDRVYRRHRNIPKKSQTSESESIGGLGRKILLRSSAESNPDEPNPKEKEISGSDVLRAIQRATAERKKSNGDKKKKKITSVELSSSVDEFTEDNGVHYSNVKPLRIKSDWKHRLEKFEKLLKEFQETEL